MATVVIDAGHGGSDPGAVRGNRLEKNDTLRFSLALGRVLSDCGINVVYTRTTDVFVPLAERSNISNRANADVFVSVHRNASVNPAWFGFENWIYRNPSADSVVAAYLVQDRIVKAGVTRNNGVLRGNFSVLRLTRAPAMLLELGFLSNARDNEFFDTRFDQYAAAAANGILSFLGLSCSGGTAPPPTPPPPPSGNRLNGTVRTMGGNLNFRSAPNTSAPIIGLIPNGSAVQILGEQNGFYRVVFNNQTGWASSNFINPIAQNGTVVTQGGNLNLRSAPSLNAAVIASIPNGSAVRVEDINGNFFRVIWLNRSGWASRDFIRT